MGCSECSVDLGNRYRLVSIRVPFVSSSVCGAGSSAEAQPRKGGHRQTGSRLIARGPKACKRTGAAKFARNPDCVTPVAADTFSIARARTRPRETRTRLAFAKFANCPGNVGGPDRGQRDRHRAPIGFAQRETISTRHREHYGKRASTADSIRVT